MSSNLQSSVESTGSAVGTPSIFRALPADAQAQLRQSAIRYPYSDGAPVQYRGDHADGFYVIERGQVKLGHLNADGEMHTLVILGMGDSFGELACLSGFKRVVDAQAIGDTDILWVSNAALDNLLNASPGLARGLMAILAAQLQESLDLLIVFRKMPAGKRMAHALLAMAEGRAPPVALSLRHQDLAELIGVSRMTVSTILTELESLGLVARRYRTLSLPDPAALRRWMRG
jgi:CRP/FNR family transcriptional regulator, cyclic AMP receptor protein